MKGVEGRKEGRERLLLAAQDPGPEQGPRISGRDGDPYPSVRSGGERSFLPVGNPRSHPSLSSARIPPSFLLWRGTHIPPSLLRVLCFPLSFLSPGVEGTLILLLESDLRPSTLPSSGEERASPTPTVLLLQGSPHRSIPQGRNPHPSPSLWHPVSLPPASTRVPPLAE